MKTKHDFRSDIGTAFCWLFMSSAFRNRVRRRANFTAKEEAIPGAFLIVYWSIVRPIGKTIQFLVCDIWYYLYLLWMRGTGRET